MKKILFSLVALVCSMSTNAQVVMKVMKNGEEVAKYFGMDYEFVYEKDGKIRGTAKRTGDIEVTWVKLWDFGPKFAEYNVGAANNKAEDFGGHYAWGGSQNNVDDHISGAVALTGDNDTATKLWGSAWRMPTEEEFKTLLAKCDSEWTTVNGVIGRKYTGRGDYASNSLFLPAAGDNDNTKDEGCYWSSTNPGDWERALCWRFVPSGDHSFSYCFRRRCCSVRAVLAE